MENNNNQITVWQRLTRAFGPNALLNQDYPTYKFDKKELLRTTSKQERVAKINVVYTDLHFGN